MAARSRYWFDTEFIDDGHTIELISIGVVADDGRTFYAVSTDFDPARPNDWVRANVLPKLPPAGDPAWRSRAAIAADLRVFVGGGRPEFWAFYAAYDWIVLSQLYGPLTDRPSGWPLRCRDVAELGAFLPHVPKPPEHENAHDALEDARWAKDYWDRLVAQLGRRP